MVSFKANISHLACQSSVVGFIVVSGSGLSCEVRSFQMDRTTKKGTDGMFLKFGFLVEALNNRRNDFRAMRQSNLIFVIRF